MGTALRTRAFDDEFVKLKVSRWVSEIENLADTAMTQPQVAYAVLTHGLMNEWIFLMRTIPDIDDLFQPLEEAIRLPTFAGSDREVFLH